MWHRMLLSVRSKKCSLSTESAHFLEWTDCIQFPPDKYLLDILARPTHSTLRTHSMWHHHDNLFTIWKMLILCSRKTRFSFAEHTVPFRVHRKGYQNPKTFSVLATSCTRIYQWKFQAVKSSNVFICIDALSTWTKHRKGASWRAWIADHLVID